MTRKLFVIVLILTGILTGCKYDDGPCISLRSANKRLTGDHGYFTLTEYKVDGIDSLSSYNDSLGLDFRFINNDEYDSHFCIISGKRSDGYETYFHFNWELIDNNKKLQIIFSTLSANPSGIGVFTNTIDLTTEWTFLKFKYENVILETTYNNKDYYINLKRK